VFYTNIRVKTIALDLQNKKASTHTRCVDAFFVCIKIDFYKPEGLELE
jgi:hypothetical protein